MKKTLTAILMLCVASFANAQFEQGTKYVGANVSGLGISYSNGMKFQVGIGAEAGYYIRDSWMIKGNFNYDHQYKVNSLSLGAGFRYHFIKNGIFLGAGLAYDYQYRGNDYSTVTFTEPSVALDGDHNTIRDTEGQPIYVMTTHQVQVKAPSTSFNSLCIPMEAGYTFYLNNHLAIEPSVYYKLSLNKISDCSTFGVRVGLGYYF